MLSSRPQGRKCSCSLLHAPSRARKGFLASIWHPPHKFGCPFYFHEQKSIFERRLNFNNIFLGTSVHFCLKSIRKAGTYTIFPSLTFCPIVDEEKSPAFQLVRQAESNYWKDKGNSPHLIRNLISQIRSVYEEGSASPKDITPSGRNILYVSGPVETLEGNSTALTNALESSIIPVVSPRGDDTRFP